jgi:hypothetical protein
MIGAIGEFFSPGNNKLSRKILIALLSTVMSVGLSAATANAVYADQDNGNSATAEDQSGGEDEGTDSGETSGSESGSEISGDSDTPSGADDTAETPEATAGEQQEANETTVNNGTGDLAEEQLAAIKPGTSDVGTDKGSGTPGKKRKHKGTGTHLEREDGGGDGNGRTQIETGDGLPETDGVDPKELAKILSTILGLTVAFSVGGKKLLLKGNEGKRYTQGHTTDI